MITITMSDSVRITTPPLARETMQRVLELIRTDVSEDKVRVDNPTQNLESYFLGVVERAKQAALETSGATSGSRVAAYLRGDAEGKPGADKVLERLTLPSAAAKAEQPAAPTAAETVDRARLDALTKPTEPSAPSPEQRPATETPKPADLSKANEKLSSLLGKPNGSP